MCTVRFTVENVVESPNPETVSGLANNTAWPAEVGAKGLVLK